jgi:tryptophan synthase alpha chain
MTDLATVQTSLDRIAALFATGHSALMPYFPIGFPDRATSLDVIETLSRSGADAFELGLSFSDPLADGPTIQHATQVALHNGITTAQCLAAVMELRARGVLQPLLLMGYYNPILAYGPDRFVAEAATAGVDGFIVPDLPPEESGELDRLARARELALIHFLAPTSTDERIARVARQARGFIYLVSLTGVTGARSKLSEGLSGFIARVQRVTSTPLVVGFGVSTPGQAAEVSRLADGVIVGSALVRTVDQSIDKAQAAAQFCAALKSNMR